jgi:hypothetical protein
MRQLSGHAQHIVLRFDRRSPSNFGIVFLVSSQCGAWRGGCPGDAATIDLQAASRRDRRELRFIQWGITKDIGNDMLAYYQ